MQGFNISEGPHDLIGMISERRIALCDTVEPIARALWVHPRTVAQAFTDTFLQIRQCCHLEQIFTGTF